jgi:hypothetical protein
MRFGWRINFVLAGLAMMAGAVVAQPVPVVQGRAPVEQGIALEAAGNLDEALRQNRGGRNESGERHPETDSPEIRFLQVSASHFNGRFHECGWKQLPCSLIAPARFRREDGNVSAIPENACLTPSEMVFLAGNRFAPKGGVGDKYTLLGQEIYVSKKLLATRVYAAAFLAEFGYGSIVLEVKEKKAMLGLRSVRQVFVQIGSNATPSPVPSLEASLRSLSERLQASRASHEVKAVVASFLQQDDGDPFAKANDLIKDQLARRGLVQRWEEKRLKIFTVAKYALPAETAALAAAGVDAIQSWLTQCQQSQSELWQLLVADIEAGIKSRQTRSDTTDNQD